MPTASRSPSSPVCIERLLDLSEAAWNGDAQASAALRLIGELLDLVGGAEALTRVQGEAHDYQLDHRRGRDLAGHLGSYWEHIPTWAAL